MASRDALAQVAEWFAPLDVAAQPRSTPVPSHLHQQLSPRPMPRQVESLKLNHELRDRPQERSQLLGVGMVFQVLEDKSLCVAQIEPNCSAARCGVIDIDDEVLRIDAVNVEKQPISILKETVLGRQGTYVTMTFRRKTPKGPYVYEIELMRGAAEFLEVVAKCKSMAKEQSQLMNKVRELEGTVKSQKDEKDAILRQYDDITSRTQAIQHSAESSLASAKSEIETAKNEIAYLRSAQHSAEDNSKAALRYAQELEEMKAEKDRAEASHKTERQARQAATEALAALKQSLAREALLREEAERRLEEATQSGERVAERERQQAEIEERLAMLEVQLAGKAVEVQQLFGEKARLESRLAAAAEAEQVALRTAAGREAELMRSREELAAVKKEGSEAQEERVRELTGERDSLAGQVRREQEQAHTLRAEAAAARKAAEEAAREREAAWREEREGLEGAMKQLQQELQETAARQRGVEETRSELEELRAKAAKTGIEAAVREEQLEARARAAEERGAAAERAREAAEKAAERAAAGLGEKQGRCVELEGAVQEHLAGKALAEKEVAAYRQHLRKVELELVVARQQTEGAGPRQEEVVRAMAEAEERLRRQAAELEAAQAAVARLGEEREAERSGGERREAQQRAAAEALRGEARRLAAELQQERAARARAEGELEAASAAAAAAALQAQEAARAEAAGREGGGEGERPPRPRAEQLAAGGGGAARAPPDTPPPLPLKAPPTPPLPAAPSSPPANPPSRGYVPPPAESALSHWSPAKPPPSDGADARLPARDAAPSNGSHAQGRGPSPVSARNPEGGRHGSSGSPAPGSPPPSSPAPLSLDTSPGALAQQDQGGRPKSILSNYFAQGVRPPTPPATLPQPLSLAPSRAVSSLALSPRGARSSPTTPAAATSAPLPPTPSAASTAHGAPPSAAAAHLKQLYEAQRAAALQAAQAGADAAADSAESAAPPSTAVAPPTEAARAGGWGGGVAGGAAVAEGAEGAEGSRGGEGGAVELPGHGALAVPAAGAEAEGGRAGAEAGGDACERLAQQGFAVGGPQDPLDGPISPAAVLLRGSPGRGLLAEEAGRRRERGGRVRFDDGGNSVLAFVPTVTEVLGDAEGAGPQAQGESEAEAEEGGEEDPGAEALVRENTAINAGSAFSFC